MKVCPHCGEPNSERARFCQNCGRPFPIAESLGEERKTVTVVFCDLVGFTARSDRADPEDVKATLRPYHTRLKREIERFGGTLDKFVGDGVMAVFGAPAVHEDDTRRALLCALRIQEAMEELNEEATPQSQPLTIRTGVATGEAVVAFWSGPQIGEAVTGDVVNVASRIQSVAPVGGIVVDQVTRDVVQDDFEFHGEGQGGADRPVEGASCQGQARRRGRPPRAPVRSLRRSRRRAVAPEGGVPARRPRVVGATGDGHRGAGHRQEPDSRRVPQLPRRPAGSRSMAPR